MTNNIPRIRVLGAGLAGPEAALQAARLGCYVDLYEMRPVRSTEAHRTADFAELVCSNSLKSESKHTAPWLLKQEMRLAGSVLLQAADAAAVPAGHALAVDRVAFSRLVADAIAAEPRIAVHREEVTTLDPADGWTVVASGPLTSPALSEAISRLTGSEHLAFYDSISPIVDAESIDMDRVYMAARWDKGTADYINCPMTAEEYDRFYDALVAAESVQEKEWEKLTYFEGCLPIEELARRVHSGGIATGNHIPYDQPVFHQASRRRGVYPVERRYLHELVLARPDNFGQLASPRTSVCARD